MSLRGSSDRAMYHKLNALVEEMIDGDIHFPDAKREFEKRFLERVIERENGNLSRAARVLRIHRNTLSKKLHELEMTVRGGARRPLSRKP